MQGEKCREGTASAALLEMFDLPAEGDATAPFTSLLGTGVAMGLGVLRSLGTQLQRLQ